MIRRSLFVLLFCCVFLHFFLFQHGESLDPYKVLGVERSASQREIQKAFHKLSLQYHPDKNKSKNAQKKFSEINNAYDILSDEEKRKNYDMYGDEEGGPKFTGGNYGSQEGYTYFHGGGQGSNHFTFKPGGSQGMWGENERGGFNSFSYSFGSPGSSSNSFSFGLDDLFSNFFGSGWMNGKPYSGFGSSTNSKHGSSYQSTRIQSINSHVFDKDISDQGFTWLLLFYTHSQQEKLILDSMMDEVSLSLDGAIKVGSVNCQTDLSLCYTLGVWPIKSVRLYVYSYKLNEKGSLVEYTDNWDTKSLKKFCQDHLPKFSKRVNVGLFDFFSNPSSELPQILLLSSKKDTPVIWRVISGLYRKQFSFYDAEIHDVSDPSLKRLRVYSLPAVIGRTLNGEMHVLASGLSVNDLKSGVNQLKILLDSFYQKNKKAGSTHATSPQDVDSKDRRIPYLSSSNFDTVCGENTTLCIIGIFKSSKSKDKLDSIFSTVSQMTLMRRPNVADGFRDSVSYSLLDGSKQSTFLNAFDKSGFKSMDKLLLAYKPRKQKFAAFVDELTMEEVERFISSVLNGDIQFTKMRQKPIVK